MNRNTREAIEDAITRSIAIPKDLKYAPHFILSPIMNLTINHENITDNAKDHNMIIASANISSILFKS